MRFEFYSAAFFAVTLCAARQTASGVDATYTENALYGGIDMRFR